MARRVTVLAVIAPAVTFAFIHVSAHGGVAAPGHAVTRKPVPAGPVPHLRDGGTADPAAYTKSFWYGIAQKVDSAT